MPYNLYEQVRRLVESHGGEVAAETFAGEVTLELVFAVDDCAAFDAALMELSAGRLAVDWQAAPP